MKCQYCSTQRETVCGKLSDAALPLARHMFTELVLFGADSVSPVPQTLRMIMNKANVDGAKPQFMSTREPMATQLKRDKNARRQEKVRLGDPVLVGPATQVPPPPGPVSTDNTSGPTRDSGRTTTPPTHHGKPGDSPVSAASVGDEQAAQSPDPTFEEFHVVAGGDKEPPVPAPASTPPHRRASTPTFMRLISSSPEP